MRRHALGLLKWLVMIGSSSILFQTTATTTGTTTTGTTTGTTVFTGRGGAGNFGCTRFASNSVAKSIDWCYLLDCQNGFFGGLVKPCADPSIGGGWILDCPGGTTTGTGTTGTTTGTGTTGTGTTGTGTTGTGTTGTGTTQ